MPDGGCWPGRPGTTSTGSWGRGITITLAQQPGIGDFLGSLLGLVAGAFLGGFGGGIGETLGSQLFARPSIGTAYTYQPGLFGYG